MAGAGSGLLHLACLEAGGADVESSRRAVHDRADLLDVGVPTPLGPPVGVAELHPEAGVLAADLAHGRHDALFVSSFGNRTNAAG
jgi:hypothetical protein